MKLVENNKVITRKGFFGFKIVLSVGCNKIINEKLTGNIAYALFTEWKLFYLFIYIHIHTHTHSRWLLNMLDVCCKLERNGFLLIFYSYLHDYQEFGWVNVTFNTHTDPTR